MVISMHVRYPYHFHVRNSCVKLFSEFSVELSESSFSSIKHNTTLLECQMNPSNYKEQLAKYHDILLIFLKRRARNFFLPRFTSVTFFIPFLYLEGMAD